MADNFKIDDRDLKQFQKMIGKDYPSGFRRVVASYLNSMAFSQRDENKKNLMRQFIIRDERFLNSHLRVEKTKPVNINEQIAISGSVTAPRFTGWKEQQEGKKPERKRTISVQARGSRTNKLPNKYRLRPSNQIYKPSQYKNNFYFMMRVLASRGGGQFYLENKIKTKNGYLNPGLWSLNKHILTLLQKKDDNQKIKRDKWVNESFRRSQQKAERDALNTLEYQNRILKAKHGL